jgi:hypothetical protein
MNDWPVQKQRMQTALRDTASRLLLPDRHVMVVCLIYCLEELAYYGFTFKLPMSPRRAHSTSTITICAYRQSERSKTAGHNPGTVN